MRKSRKREESKFDFIEEYAKAAEEADRELESSEVSAEEADREPESSEVSAEEADREPESSEVSAEETAENITEYEAEGRTSEEPEEDAAAEAEETVYRTEAEEPETPVVEPSPEALSAEESDSEDDTGENARGSVRSHGIEDEDDDEDDLTPEKMYERRHKRRVKSEIIAYSGMLAVLLVIGVGIGFLVHFLAGIISDKKAEEAAAAALAEQAAAEQEAVVVEAPESVTEQTETVEDTYPEEEPLEEVDYLEEMVTSTISQMPIEDKVAQLFMVTPEQLTGVGAATKAGDGTRDALAKYAVCGLVYDKKNIESEDQLIELIDNTKNMSKYELFFAIREAGGESCALSGSALGDIPAVDKPSDIAATGEASNAYNAGVTIASYMSYFHFNMDIAPNGSLTSDEASVSADLSYGSDEASACEMITQMINGLSTGSISACMTDFPGTGDITASTSEGRVESEVTADELNSRTVPYITGAAAGAAAIQTNNVTYINADSSDMPASLSEYIIGRLLRGEMAYNGIIITAPLNEKAITDNYTSEEAVLNAVAAGADIIYMPENLEEGYNALLEAVSNGTVPESRIDESLDRIFRVKFAGYME